MHYYVRKYLPKYFKNYSYVNDRYGRNHVFNKLIWFETFYLSLVEFSVDIHYFETALFQLRRSL